MESVWAGLHDHSDSAARWIDARVSYTWLRAFEKLSVEKPMAYLAEHNYSYNVEEPVRAVYYKFRDGPIGTWVDDIVAQKPSLILYNVCYYSVAAAALQHIRDHLKDTVHVIRIHHQVTYLAAQPGFREFLLSCDVAIAPTEAQIDDVRRLGFTGKIYALPFGINAAPMLQASRPFESRDIVIGSASNSHPARNLALVEEVYERLRQRGRNVENFSGLPPVALAEKLGRTKIFWQTSMTEASGSRILPEAMAAGCFPVVMDECGTTKELIVRHGTGQSLKSGIAFDYHKRASSYPDDIVEQLVDNLDKLAAEFDAKPSYDAPALLPDYEESQEVERLVDILEDSAKQWHRPTPNWRKLMNLPVDPDGYAFNPTFIRTAAGTLCIYRHVGGDGVRTIRRCLLDSDFGADSFGVWSDELRALGSDINWYADPRAFQVGSDFYISFNTGHSEAENQIYLVKVDDFGKPLSLPIRCVKEGGRRSIEKNWGFFSLDGNIYAVYSISPFVILRFEFVNGEAQGTPIAVHEWNSCVIEEQFGELHGGAGPIFIGNRGYYVVQSNYSSVNGVIYRGNIMEFSADIQFKPVSIAELPLFTLSVDEMRNLPNVLLNNAVDHCFYPCGIMYDEAESSIILCYGINDYRSGVRSYSLKEIDGYLVPISDFSVPDVTDLDALESGGHEGTELSEAGPEADEAERSEAKPVSSRTMFKDLTDMVRAFVRR